MSSVQNLYVCDYNYADKWSALGENLHLSNFKLSDYFLICQFKNVRQKRLDIRTEKAIKALDSRKKILRLDSMDKQSVIVEKINQLITNESKVCFVSLFLSEEMLKQIKSQNIVKVEVLGKHSVARRFGKSRRNHQTMDSLDVSELLDGEKQISTENNKRAAEKNIQENSSTLETSESNIHTANPDLVNTEKKVENEKNLELNSESEEESILTTLENASPAATKETKENHAAADDEKENQEGGQPSNFSEASQDDQKTNYQQLPLLLLDKDFDNQLTLQEIEKQIFSNTLPQTEFEKVYTAYDNLRAELINMRNDLLIANLIKCVPKIAEYSFSQEQVMSLIILLANSNTVKEFTESWVVVESKFPLVLLEKSYYSLKKECIFYLDLCEMLYAEDKWY